MINVTMGDVLHLYGGIGRKLDYTVRLSVRITDPIIINAYTPEGIPQEQGALFP